MDAALDDVLLILATERRRRILAAICETADAMAVSTAERVADRLTSVCPESASDVGIPRIRVASNHQHLPRVAAAGLVEYDTRSRTVRKIDAVNF